jgi:hypothetical protein
MDDFGFEELDFEFAEYMARAREEFEAGFRRNLRGNLSRSWEGKTVTVFRRDGSEKFRWSIADSNEPVTYSRCAYDCEADALSGMAAALGVGL